jgi:hypothetical protein
MPCPACGFIALEPHLQIPRLELWRCPGCVHIVGLHRDAGNERDYHEQYGSELAGALERTRRRQAARVATALERHGAQENVVDFGCGRGWFLQELRARGFRAIAGMDTSELGVSMLRDREIEGHVLAVPMGDRWQITTSAVSFPVATLTFLDVIEHFEPGRLSTYFQHAVRAFSDLRFVAVKVPMSSGLLYRVAELASKARVYGPLAQLWQQGTFPPHYHYFSRRSLHTFLARNGFEAIEEMPDADFDAGEFRDRVAVLRRLPAAIGLAAGVALRGAVQVTRAFDSVIVIARRVSAGFPEYRERAPAAEAGIPGSTEAEPA